MAYQFVQELVDMLTADEARLIKVKSDEFLNYDPKFLKSFYHQEVLVHPGILYKELVGYSDLQNKSFKTIVVPGDFDRLKNASPEWAAQSEKVFTKFSMSGKAPKNGQMIHPVAIDVGNDITFTVQKCGYFDQVATHLGADYKEKPGDVSLREIEDRDYHGYVPGLQDGRLSNSLGVGIIVFYLDDDGEEVPCIYRRTENVAVFGGSPNCTASGAVDYPAEGEPQMLDTVKDRIQKEVLEETGLQSDEIYDLEPIFIGQELARMGKVQIFYAARTTLRRDELAKRMKQAGRAAKKTGIQEFELFLVENHIDILPPRKQLKEYLSTSGMASEGAANLVLARDYLQKCCQPDA